MSERCSGSCRCGRVLWFSLVVISLTLTPMMCARLLRHEAGSRGGSIACSNARLTSPQHLRNQPKDRARHRFGTLLMMLGTIAFTGYLYVVIPKGSSPSSTPGHTRLSEAAQDIHFRQWPSASRH